MKTASQKHGTSNRDVETRFDRETINDVEFLTENLERVSRKEVSGDPRSKSPEDHGNDLIYQDSTYVTNATNAKSDVDEII